jgi:hypothetical protein
VSGLTSREGVPSFKIQDSMAVRSAGGGAYSYSYSYSKRWFGVWGLGVWLGSSTSTALRAEHKYEGSPA